MINFLVVEDCKLPKRTSHILSALWNLKCFRILSWSISFFYYFNCLPNDVLCKIATWSDDNAVNSSCDKPSDLTQQVLIWSWKYEKCNTRDIGKYNSVSNYILIFGKLFYLYKLIHIDLKPRILKASFLLAPLLNN